MGKQIITQVLLSTFLPAAPRALVALELKEAQGDLGVRAIIHFIRAHTL